MLDLESLQREQKVWADHNFPDRLPYYPLLGIMEEIGELNFASRDGNILEMKDGIADIMVFMGDYCNQHHIQMAYFGNCLKPRSLVAMTIMLSRLSEYGGKLCHFHLKGEQGIRYKPDEILTKKMDAIGNIISTLADLSDYLNTDLLTIVEPVWLKVKQRDWIKNPASAHKGLGDTHD